MYASDNKNSNYPNDPNNANNANNANTKEDFRCDMRRAVLILNILAIINFSFTLIMYDYLRDLYKRVRVFPATLDNDSELEEAFDDIIRKSIILIGVGIGATALSVYGAFFYQSWAVALNAMYVITVLNIIFFVILFSTTKN